MVEERRDELALLFVRLAVRPEQAPTKDTGYKGYNERSLIILIRFLRFKRSVLVTEWAAYVIHLREHMVQSSWVRHYDLLLTGQYSKASIP